MSGLLVAAPLRLEAALISSGAPALRVRKVGMGPARSKTAAALLAGDPAEAILVMGVCGGLQASDEPGEVIVADEVWAVDDEGRPDGEAVRCTGAETLAGALARRGLRTRRGSIACSPRIVHGTARSELARRGADAVEMESVWLAAGAQGRPFAVIRVVADTPVHDLRRPERALHGWWRAAVSLRAAARELQALTRERDAQSLFR